MSYTSYGLPYGLTADYETPNDVYDYWFSDDFVDDVEVAVEKFRTK